jgi:hypothetical protein
MGLAGLEVRIEEVGIVECPFAPGPVEVSAAGLAEDPDVRDELPYGTQKQVFFYRCIC